MTVFFSITESDRKNRRRSNSRGRGGGSAGGRPRDDRDSRRDRDRSGRGRDNRDKDKESDKKKDKSEDKKDSDKVAEKKKEDIPKPGGPTGAEPEKAEKSKTKMRQSIKLPKGLNETNASVTSKKINVLNQLRSQDFDEDRRTRKK